jgi:hypothetical protein
LSVGRRYGAFGTMTFETTAAADAAEATIFFVSLAGGTRRW